MAKKKHGWGARIYEARSAMLRQRGRKMTQGELGKAVGVSAQQIGFYESETNEPSWDMWRKMAKALLINDPGELAFGTRPTVMNRGRPSGTGEEGTG